MSATDRFWSRRMARHVGHGTTAMTTSSWSPDCRWRLVRGSLRTSDAKLPHPVHQRCPLHPESRRSPLPTADHPKAGFERTEDVISFDLRETTEWRIGVLVSAERL